jgi:hypothetical protein
LKAAKPDIESQPVNTAGFGNCGDDVPASLAIEANNAISLPAALQKSPACHAQCRALTTSKATRTLQAEFAIPVSLVMMLSPAFVLPQTTRGRSG